MTLHAAKGLEFPVVAMLGLEEGCLPHSRARDSLGELEEERRLAFVGITRAQSHLILSRAQYRTQRGVRERTVPSPFLKEVPAEHLEEVDRTGIAGAAGERWSSVPTNDISGRYKVGQKLRHTTFGLGKVLDVSPGTNARITIDFGKLGKKTLMLDIAASKLAAAS